MNSEPYTVIGVSPRISVPPQRLLRAAPLTQPAAKSRVDHDFGVVARLKTASPGSGAGRVGAIARRIDAETPRLAGWDVTVLE
jgi:hypothetical protein